jgi:hypothetical protein
MWSDEFRHARSRVHRRRILVGLTLGAVAGAVAVGLAVGVLHVAAAAVMAATILGGAWLQGSSPERTLGHRWQPARSTGEVPPDLAEEPQVVELDEIRETRLGSFGRFRVTPRTLVIEGLLATTAARIEDLAWVYGVHDPSRRWIPLLPDASLVLKFVNGAEIALPCFYRQVTPCLSAIRYFAGHVALGWDPELATSWEANRAMFVASVQARLGRVSGAGGDA